MVLYLYSTEFHTPLPDDSFRLLLGQLPPALQQKPLRFRRWEDAHANLLGKHLLRLALENAGYAADLDQLRYSPADKPWLPGGPHFNISHSGNRVVCLLSTNGRVGIDIEHVHSIAFEDFQSQFTPKEWAAIHASASPADTFFRFWTAKESLIKADGRGLGIPLLQLDVSEYRPIPLDGTTWQLRPLDCFPGYAAHFTFEESPEPAITIREIPTADF